ncbi:MAG: hypothetical protein AMXMBFR84_38800 [Candidatus Hydrogenedentota bacterium]
MDHAANAGSSVFWKSPLQIITFAAILALGIGLRVYKLDAESLWFDEAVSVAVLDEPTLMEFIDAERAQDPAMMPLYFVFEYYIGRATGYSIYALRLFSVSTSVIAMILLYAFGRSLLGHFCGLTAMFMLAVSKNHIWHSQDIRMYSLYYALAIVSAYGFYLAYHRGKRWVWPICILANAAMLGTHFFGCTLVFVQGLILLFGRGWKRPHAYVFAAAHVPILIPFFWWVSGFSQTKIESMIGWIPKPSLQVLFDSYLYVFTGAMLFGNEELYHLIYPGGLFVGLVFAFLLLRMLKFCMGKIKQWQLQADSDSHHRLIIDLDRCSWVALTQGSGFSVSVIYYLLAWLFIPMIVLFVLSHTVKECYVERYVLHSSYAMFLLGAAAITTFRSGFVRFVAVGAVAFTCAYVLEDLKRPMRPDWNGAAELIAAEFKTGDVIRIPETFRNENGLPMRTHNDDLPIKGVAPNFANEVMRLACLGNTVWVPLVVQANALSPKMFSLQLDAHNLPYEFHVRKGRREVAVFKINEDRDYFLETLGKITDLSASPINRSPDYNPTSEAP